MRATYGIYHSKDLDGIACGAIIKKAYPEAILIGYDYGEPFDIKKFRNQDVIMADVSLPVKDMIELDWVANSFHWIDHHRSAINDFNHSHLRGEFSGKASLKDGTAACRIAWEVLIGTAEPIAIELLGKYDVWDQSDPFLWNEAILPFQYGMRIDCVSPETLNPDFLSATLTGNLIDQIILVGKSILKYQKEFDKKQCERNAFYRYVKGMATICMNSGTANSQLFESVYDPQDHDMMLRYQFDGKKYNCSIYTTKEDMDCSVIAKSFGGGGHRKAAGFIVNDINEIFS